MVQNTDLRVITPALTAQVASQYFSYYKNGCRRFVMSREVFNLIFHAQQPCSGRQRHVALFISQAGPVPEKAKPGYIAAASNWPAAGLAAVTVSCLRIRTVTVGPSSLVKA